MLNFSIAITDHGRRLDSFLRNLLPAAASSYIHQIIKGGGVTVNGAPSTPGALIRTGDRVDIKETSRILQLVSSEKSLTDILYEDDHVVLFNKPAGLSVHRSAEHGSDNLAEIGARALAARSILAKLYPVNRLDRDTSGIAVMAKSSAKAGAFGKLFQGGNLAKRYLAVVSGNTASSGTIDLPLDDKESLSEYRTLFSGKGVSILSITPVTGRSHQIRRHLAAIGHPVMGDRRYGGKTLRAMRGHALHSYCLAFVHPVTSCKLMIFAPPPAPFAEYIAELLSNQTISMLESLITEHSQHPFERTSP